MNNIVLVFGIGGFVGPYLGKEFKQNGYIVYGADTIERQEAFEFDGYFKSDILDKEAIKSIIQKVRPSHIINLAAISSVGQSWKNPELTMKINVNGTLNILESCLLLDIKPKILLIGSSEEYVPLNSPINESAPISANNPYGISKVAQEQFASLYREKYNWDIFCVRSFNHIGVGQRPSFVVPSWCSQVAKIEKGICDPVLRVGNLNVVRDFTDVRDIVRAYRLVVESKDSSQIYNLGSGKAYSLKDILSIVLSFSTKRIEIIIDDSLIRPTDNPFICCDNKKAKTLLGWEPKNDIVGTIKDIYFSFLKSA